LGGPYAIAPSNASGGTFTASNYAIAYVNGALTVIPANLLVTVANASKIFGETPTLTAFSVAGLVNGETVGAFTETSPGTAASASVAGSPYVITAGSASGGTFTASNYSIAYVNGQLTVLPRTQVLSVVVPSVMTANVETAATPAIVLAGTPAELQGVLPAELPPASSDADLGETPKEGLNK
jgi:hypothetical protein